VANALLLPIVMQYNMAFAIDKYVDIAKAMGINVHGFQSLMQLKLMAKLQVRNHHER
jgi:alcohol dehydrogenase class IV